MTIKSIMVALQLGEQNTATLEVAADIAALFAPHVLGIAMCQPIQVNYNDGYLSPEIVEEDRKARMKQITIAEAEFREKLRDSASSLSWHGGITPANVAMMVATRARGADMIVASAGCRKGIFEGANAFRIGDLIMRAGRPVLSVPSGAPKLGLNHVLVGWKDGREARRAVADSLPLLGKAKRVTVVEIAAAGELDAALDRVVEVTAWLSRHRIAVAEPLALASDGDDTGRLPRLALERGSDLIVAGAYAHSRFQEYVFGGMTRGILFHGGVCALVSH